MQRHESLSFLSFLSVKRKENPYSRHVAKKHAQTDSGMITISDMRLTFMSEPTPALSGHTLTMAA